MKVNKYGNEKKDITYKSFSFDKDNQEFISFFDMCLENKLFNQNKNSHMLGIFNNDTYKFKGLDAIVAYNKNNKPIALIYNKRTIDQHPTWLDASDYKNHLSTKIENNQNLFIHPFAIKHAHNRNTKSPFKEILEGGIIHVGFMMFYTSPEYRELGIAKELLKEMENLIITRIEKSLPFLPENIRNNMDINKISCTAVEKANQLITNYSKLFTPTGIEPQNSNYINYIDELSNTDQVKIKNRKIKIKM